MEGAPEEETEGLLRISVGWSTSHVVGAVVGFTFKGIPKWLFGHMFVRGLGYQGQNTKNLFGKQ
jgi:hypothetical protein